VAKREISRPTAWLGWLLGGDIIVLSDKLVHTHCARARVDQHGPGDVFKRTGAVNLIMAVTCRFVPPVVAA
jgi:hypothetical protein